MAYVSNRGQTNNTILMIGGVVALVLVLIIGWWVFNRNTEEEVFEPDLFEEEGSLTDDELIVATATPTPTPTTTPSVSPSPAETTSPSPAAAGQVKSFTVAASNFAFSLKEMRVEQGDTVRVTLTNGSTMPHDWRVDEFNAATKTITNGQTDTVEFVASKAGTYEYYCSIGTHRQMGMVGKLIVE